MVERSQHLFGGPGVHAAPAVTGDAVARGVGSLSDDLEPISFARSLDAVMADETAAGPAVVSAELPTWKRRLAVQRQRERFERRKNGLRITRPAGRPNAPSSQRPTQITSPTDPRWVLMHRVTACLQGSMVSPEDRERLVRAGKVMGLTPFHAQLIIAIVQDQARRGIPAEAIIDACSEAAACIPLPQTRSLAPAFRRTGLWLAVIITVEIALVTLWLL